MLSILVPAAQLHFPCSVFKTNNTMGIFPGIMAKRNMELHQEVNGPESEI